MRSVCIWHGSLASLGCCARMCRNANNSQKARLPKRDVGAILVPRQRPEGSSKGVTVGQKVPREYVHADQPLSCHYISFLLQLFQFPTTTHPPTHSCCQLHSTTLSHASTHYHKTTCRHHLPAPEDPPQPATCRPSCGALRNLRVSRPSSQTHP